MISKFIEVTQPARQNWGKFMVARFELEEMRRPSFISDIARPLLRQRGWDEYHILVMDLETGEGALFRPGGIAKADLDKHKIWVCPMFEPFLAWLYKQDLHDIKKLPNSVELDAEFELYGHRRPGSARSQT